VANVEYFVQVPNEATEVTFDLKTLDTGVNFDLYGRCDSGFTVADNRVIPPTFDLSDQATEFSAAGSGDESRALTSSSAPTKKTCTYYLLIVKASPSSEGRYQLTATLKGTAKIVVATGSAPTVTDGSGDIIVLSKSLTAEGDSFSISALTFFDEGDGDLSRVSKATLIADTDNNGLVGGSDRTVAQTTLISNNARSITFSGLSETLAKGATTSYLLVYTVSSSARWGEWALLLLVGALAGLFRNRLRPYRVVASLLLVTILLSSCPSDDTPAQTPTNTPITPSGFVPTIEASSIGAVADTFRRSFTVEIE
jgi:hypothetical protein